MSNKKPEIEHSGDEEVSTEERANIIDVLAVLNLSSDKDLVTSLQIATKNLRELIIESNKPSNSLLNLVLQLEDELGEVLSELINQYYDTVVKPVLTTVAAEIISTKDDELILKSVRTIEALQQEVAQSVFAEYINQDDIQDYLELELSKITNN